MLLLHISLVFISLLLLLFVYLLRWRDYRLPVMRQRRKADEEALPAVSIVIPAHNQALQLEENLPYLMRQKYEKFEIIIVDIHSSDYTMEVIKRFENPNVILRNVKLPATSRYIGKNRLAMSLGIRAAHFPWIVFTQPDCRPQNDTWLYEVAQQMTEDKNIVLGYSNFEDERGRVARRAVYDRLRMTLSNIRALYRGRAVSADICNFAIRKSFYMDEHPLSNKLTVPFGEVALLADKYATKAQAAVAISQDAAVLQQLPHRSTLASQRMYMAETSRHKSFRARLYRLREGLATCCTYLFAATVLLYITIRVLVLSNFQFTSLDFRFSVPVSLLSASNSPEIIICDITVLLLIALGVCIPLVLLRKTCRSLDIRPFGLRPLWYDFSQPFRTFFSKVQRWRHRKDFVRPIIPSKE